MRTLVKTTALALAKEGAAVVLSARRRERLEEVAAAIDAFLTEVRDD